MAAPMKKNKRETNGYERNGKGTAVRYADVKKKYILNWYRSRLKANPYAAKQATLAHFKISYTALALWLSQEKGSVSKNAFTKAKAQTAITKAITVMQKLQKSLN